MAVRMTGMISGLDTESLIKGMMDAQKLKNKKVEDKQTLLSWKQDKWKELNTKLYKLYTEDLNKMRLQGSYQTKQSTSSNDTIASITAGTTAPEGAHSLTISQLASSQYVTGGKLDSTVTASTTLKGALGMTNTAGTDLVIQLVNGTTKKDVIVTDKTTLGDFVNAAKEIGLNASYDTTQQRLFISSKSSGAAGNFSITTGEMSTSGSTALTNIRSLVNYTGVSATTRNNIDTAVKSLEGKVISDTLYNTVMTADPKVPVVGGNPDEQKIIDALSTLRNYAIDKVKTDTNNAAVAQVKGTIKQDLLNAHPEYSTLTAAELDALVEKEYSSAELVTDGSGNTVTKATLYQNQVKGIYDANISSNTSNALTGAGGLVDSIKSYIANSTVSPSAVNNLSKIGLDEITGAAIAATTSDKITVVAASDASITLDGAAITSSSNTITVNGLTVIAKNTTGAQTISLNVSNNAQGTYDMVKNFVKKYNEVLKEMNDLYYAPSASSYAPLSDDEKSSMTDDQITKWETKILDSILRRDSSLGSLLEGMRTSLNKSVDVSGVKYALSTFGIQTSSDYTEKGLLHIYGDKDEAIYSTSENKLMQAIEKDPDSVMKALSGIAQNLYDSMNDKMSSIPNVKSALTFYNDKTMAKQQTDYTKQIADLEVKLTNMENKYYKQFAAMETAMAKLQSQSNALAGMLGTSSK